MQKNLIQALYVVFHIGDFEVLGGRIRWKGRQKLDVRKWSDATNLDSGKV